MDEKKRIGIINLQFTPNYGAVIGAAVLEDAVRTTVGNAFEVQTIRYIPSSGHLNRIEQILDEIRQWGGLKLFLKRRNQHTQPHEGADRRREKFTAFRNAFLHETRTFENTQQILEGANYCALITGSDVVWAPKRVDNFRADGYFLKFGDENIRKIAFAPSIDHKTDAALMKLKKHYQDGLTHLDFISVREQGSITFLQSLTDKKVFQCADPVFLVDEDYFDKMIAFSDIVNDEKYIYVYILELNSQAVDYANRLAREKGLKICYYSANHNDYNEGSENCISDGPADFLNRLKNAEYVITNSYHCICFSLIFKKKFLSFKRSGTSIKSSDLLERFGLLSRSVVTGTECNIDTPVDFEQTEAIRQELKNESIQYLSEALRDIG